MWIGYPRNRDRLQIRIAIGWAAQKCFERSF
jgi:hypothetical protein